jgi:hypothetical protein
VEVGRTVVATGDPWGNTLRGVVPWCVLLLLLFMTAYSHDMWLLVAAEVIDEKTCLQLLLGQQGHEWQHIYIYILGQQVMVKL